MNFLAHLWLARRSNTSYGGAILGDIVRGADLSAYPDEVAAGIRLHRRIDAMTDRHPRIVALREGFPQGTRRFAGIVLDVVCDHALMLDWSRYEEEPLPDFCRRSAEAVARDGEWFLLAGERAPRAEGFERLLLSYGEAAGIDLAIQRTAQRLRRPEMLIEAGAGWREVLPGVREALPELMDSLQAASAA